MLYQFFTETQDKHGVSSKDLAEAVGITPKHLSEFRRGRANITLDLLWRLVDELDRLSPGARRDFGLRIAGLGGSLVNLVEQMPPEELSDTLSAIAESLRKPRSVKVSSSRETIGVA
jgi:transcriptional regulator with XRE-family HTH domain